MPIPRKDILAVVASGGASRRFGVDKASYELAGVALAERMAREAAQVSDHVLLGFPSPAMIRPEWADLVARYGVVHDEPDGVGPLGSLAGSLAMESHEWVLLLACDMPNLTASHLSQLTSHAGRDNRVIAATGDGIRPEPLCALYRRTLLPDVRHSLSNGDYAIHRLLTRVGWSPVAFPAKALHNVNSREDLIDPDLA